MKISIDTAQDSKEEIRKVIKLLQALADTDASKGSRNIFDSPNAELFSNNDPVQSEPSVTPTNVTNAFGSMFGDDAPEPSTSVEIPEKKDKHKVELY